MSTIECGLFQSSDTAAVVQLLARVFSAAEPPAIAMGLTPADLERFVRLLCPRALADGLTIVARDFESQQIAGVLLTDDFAVPPVLAGGEISDKFLPILAMLDNLDEQYRQSRSIVAGQSLHLFMLAVDEHFAGRGIAQQLVTACLANGRQKGYTHAVTEATGAVSQHVFRKLGFGDRFRVSYQDYRYDARAVFASIRDHEAAILMDRTIP
jgi:ribosomal protein S18 acetylase RimI-like enzyme